MAFELVPSSFWSFPRFPSLLDEEDLWPAITSSGGLSISEDERNVRV